MRVNICLFLLLSGSSTCAQSISAELPLSFNNSDKFVFYFHGLVVSILGDNAINNGAPEWGPYEYSKILDSLRIRNYHVISEIRDKDVHDSVYVNKTVKQVKTLLRMGVPQRQIILVGASAGWYVVLHASDQLNDKKLNYVLMGGCWPDTFKDYSALNLRGNFLSIIEKSDPHKTCGSIFHNRKTITSFKEIELNTGLSHGFFYKGWRHWIDPIVEWHAKK